MPMSFLHENEKWEGRVEVITIIRLWRITNKIVEDIAPTQIVSDSDNFGIRRHILA